VQRIIAEFDVRGIVEAAPDLLWKRTRRFAGIDEEGFYSYFEGKETGYAIEVGEVREYKISINPLRDLGIRPPQSFLYLN
jgi:predicted transcriptional regulator